MAGGQTMVTAAFFVLLIASVITANRMIGSSTTTTYEGDARNLAVDLARSVVNEAYRLKFDENSVDSLYQTSTDFTAANSLGPDAGETISPLPDVAPYQSYAKYDDVDDYNGYSRIVDAGALQGFKVTVSVYYVSSTTFAKSSTQTVLKRIDVSVEQPTYLKTKVTYSKLVTQ
jgi:hypothetical protein